MLAKMHKLAGCTLAAVLALSWALPLSAQERKGGPRADTNEVTGTLKSVDAGARTITVSVMVSHGRDGGDRPVAEFSDKTFTLAKNAEVCVGIGFAGLGGAGRGESGVAVFHAVKLTDLGTGVKVALSLSADKKTVASVLAEGPTLKGQLKAVNAAKNTITIGFAGRAAGVRGGDPIPGEEKTYSLAPHAEIVLDDGRGSRFSIKEAKLADLAQGALVTVKLHVDMKRIQSVFAEGPSHHGTIKAIDPVKRTLTVAVRPARGDDAAEEYTLTVSHEATVLVDDGTGRRVSVKQGKLADVPVGANATVKLSVDQVSVMYLRAEGARMTCQLKSVDADKGVIVVAIPKGRDDAEEKTLSVARDVHITVNGHESKLGDLKAGDNMHVELRFSLDNTTVQSIMTRQAVAGERR